VGVRSPSRQMLIATACVDSSGTGIVASRGLTCDSRIAGTGRKGVAGILAHLKA
jgi:hypothetical protein